MSTTVSGGQAVRARWATLRDAPGWMRVIVALGGVTWGVTLIVAIASSGELFIGVLLVPVFAAITVPVARHLAIHDQDPRVFGMVIAAFSAKMLGTLVRQLVSQGVYGGTLDSHIYDKAGRQLAPFYRQLDFSPDTGKLVGTGFLKALTGVVYAVIGSSEAGAFVVFAFFSFVGLLLLWRAFKRAVPHGDSKRYSYLVLFLPSLLYWSSALGKEGWGLLGVGLASYGVALLLTKRPVRGLLFLAAGLVAVTMLRPHVALVVFGGLVFAALVAKPRNSSASTPIIRVVVLSALLLVGLILVSQAKSFLGVSSLDQSSVDKKLRETSKQTGEGGSQFTPIPIRTPIDVPLATITVLFRPLPFEAHSGQELATAAENVFVLALAYTGRRRLRSIPSVARSDPYVAYCIGFCLMFIFAFSAISNFGILARQRTLTMPLFLALICLPEYQPAWKRQRDDGGEADVVDGGTENPPPSATGPYARFHDAATANDPYARFQDATTSDNPYARFQDAATGNDPYARFESVRQDRARDGTSADGSTHGTGTPPK